MISNLSAVVETFRWWNFFSCFLDAKLLLGVDIEMLNTMDKLGVNEPCVIICNHQTSLDQLRRCLSIYPSPPPPPHPHPPPFQRVLGAKFLKIVVLSTAAVLLIK